MAPPTHHLPLGMRLLNGCGSLLRHAGLNIPDLRPEALLGKAERVTGLSDFGDGGFREGLEHLLDALEQEAQLTTLGRLMAADTVTQDLIARLRLADYRKCHPELNDEEVRRPLFILGLPRTGTTLLYNLLAQDPRHRVPLGWEVIFPCPPPESESYASDPRIAQARQRFDQMDKIVPELQTIHPTGALLPEECSTITGREFESRNYSYVFDIPSYYDWYVHHSQIGVYEAHRRYLQHLQSHMRSERWLLKAPQHLPFLTDLWTVYPDAEIIQTHRDPREVIPSQASLIYHVRRATRNGIDTAKIGREKLERWSWGLDRALAARDALPGKHRQILDLRFEDLMRDPLGEVARIYDIFGWPLQAETRERMATYLEANPRTKHGTHRYTLDMFALRPEEVHERFAPYIERFGLD